MHRAKILTDNLGYKETLGGFILRHSYIFRFCELYVADPLCERFENLTIHSTKYHYALRFPDDTSFVLIGGETAKALPVSDTQKFLFVENSQTIQYEYIEGGALLYINGLGQEIFTRTNGTVSSGENYTQWEDHRYALYLEPDAYLEVNNLSAFCIHDQLFFGFSIWRIPDTNPKVTLYIEWRGLNASYKLLNSLWPSSERIKIEKYWDGGSSTEVDFTDTFYAIKNSTWNAVYMNLRSGRFCQNGASYPARSYYDGEEARWFEKIKFVVENDPIYFGCFILINFPSGYFDYLLSHPGWFPYDQDAIWNWLGRGNFYWEP